MTNVDKKVKLSAKDVYQLLTANLRYGYTRNNHLMPSTAYEQTKEIFNEFVKVDEKCAIITLKQICEECISDELIAHFYNGVDDDYGNRSETLTFIVWCIDTIYKYDISWKPYNYYMFKENLAKDDLNLYEVIVIKKDDHRSLGLTSKHNLIDFIVKNTLDNASTCTYSKEKLDKVPIDCEEGFIFHFKEPKLIDVLVLRHKE